MKRIITALIIGAIWLFILFAGSFALFWSVITLVSGVALYEYFTMVTAVDGKKHIGIGIVLGLFPLAASLSNRQDLVTVALIAAMLFLFILIITRYPALNDPFSVVSKFGFGILYIGFFSSYIILLMGQPLGAHWLVMLTAITIASDSSAYYTGSFLGKTKLCPATSPNKTIEGFIGGLVGGIAAAVLVSKLFFPWISLVNIVLTAVLLSGIGVIGDLTESTIKRAMKFKDSGTILPGHGGILDRVDSLLLTAPVFYYMIYFNLLTLPQ
ncbi:MAG: phosphatidate cytidylyltransferase [Proteobacteria bacterium]|nr:phosphatidate cytidylyltransferase [Pseudomonadota bacterium]MBU1710932.1 phosphatidate cytidylyltransferase [Pseudomonadota bacterium]